MDPEDCGFRHGEYGFSVSTPENRPRKFHHMTSSYSVISPLKSPKQRHYYCDTKLTTADCIPRVDAQASSQRTGIGGWFPVADEEGNLVPWMSSWFSLEMRKEDSSLVISTLEALAILIALKLRFGDSRDTSETRVLVVPSVTDNRGNGAALNKLMSTRFPSSAVLMELATYMKSRV